MGAARGLDYGAGVVTELGLESAEMPPRKKSPPHKKPRFLMSGSEEELAAWERVARAAGTNRVAWLRDLANAAAKAFRASAPPKRDFKPAWDAARHADVIAVAQQIKGAVISPGPTANPRAITPARLESILAQRSGFAGWRVTFDGPEFEAKPPPMPKDWKP